MQIADGFFRELKQVSVDVALKKGSAKKGTAAQAPGENTC